MDLNRSSKIFLGTAVVWALGLLALGVWWSYLILSMGETISFQAQKLGELNTAMRNTHRLVFWEGLTFFIFLSLLSLTMLGFYLKNIKRARALQSFFSAITHELKTPLASVHLQAEVIHDRLAKKMSPEELNLIDRLMEDAIKLEDQYDKLLHMAQIERGANLPLKSIDLGSFLDDFIAKNKNHNVKLRFKNNSQNKSIYVLGNYFALEVIFKNLFENSRKYAQSNFIDIEIEKAEGDYLKVRYNDHGLFLGSSKKLGKLFYKIGPSKGTGIGLYLCKQLLQKMKGGLNFIHHSSRELSFELRFKIHQPEAIS